MTIKDIESAVPGSVLWDAQVRGLHIRAFAKRRVFYFQFRTKQGMQRRPKLGDYGVLSLPAARQIAREKMRIVLQGGDPELNTEDRTVKELYEHYLSVHAPDLEPSSQRNYKQIWEAHILPVLGKRGVSQVTEQHCLTLYHSLRKTPVQANRVIAVLRAAFNLAEDWGWKPRHSNPVQVKLRQEEARRRYPTQEEAVRLLKAIEKKRKSHPGFASYVTLLILTGARPGEIQSAKREWVTPLGLELPTAKRKKRGRLIELSKAAREEIGRIAVIIGNPYLIAGKLPGSYLIGTKKLWGELLESAKIEGLQMRDLRRYFASLVLSDGFSLEQVGQLLGHTQHQTTLRYAHLFPSVRKRAAESAANSVGKLMRGARSATGEIPAAGGTGRPEARRIKDSARHASASKAQ